MKKLMLLALSMVMSGVVLAHDTGLSNRQNWKNSGFRQSMNEIHDVMHNTSISAKRSENRITFEITATSDSSIESINKRFVNEQGKLETFLKDVDVTVHSLDNGVEVVLTSNDKNIVAQLNSSGRSLVYSYLHEGTTGFSGPMGYHRGGHGPGMIHGWGNQNEMGSGMMYQKESTHRGQLGYYHPTDTLMGDDSGMM